MSLVIVSGVNAVKEMPMLEKNTQNIRTWLIAHVAEAARMDIYDIDPREPFATFGLGSVDAIALTGELEQWLDLRLPETIIWDYPTIEILTQYLTEQLNLRSS